MKYLKTYESLSTSDISLVDLVNSNISKINKWLDSHDINEEITPDECPMLFLTVRDRNLELTKYLLSKGADPNIKVFQYNKSDRLLYQEQTCVLSLLSLYNRDKHWLTLLFEHGLDIGIKIYNVDGEQISCYESESRITEMKKYYNSYLFQSTFLQYHPDEFIKLKRFVQGNICKEIRNDPKYKKYMDLDQLGIL